MEGGNWKQGRGVKLLEPGVEFREANESNCSPGWNGAPGSCVLSALGRKSHGIANGQLALGSNTGGESVSYAFQGTGKVTPTS